MVSKIFVRREWIEVGVLFDGGSDRVPILLDHPVEMASQQDGVRRLSGKDRRPGIAVLIDQPGSLLHVETELTTRRGVVQRPQFFPGQLILAFEPGEILPRLGDGLVEFGHGDAQPVLGIRDTAGHTGTSAVDGAGGSASTLNAPTLATIRSLIMVMVFQKTWITLRALLTMVIASLTVLISFHCP